SALPRQEARRLVKGTLPPAAGERRTRPYHRHVDAIAPIQPPIVQAAVIAHEVLVDVLVRSRPQAHHGVVACLDHDIAALRAVRAHRRSAVHLPRPRLVQRVLREERADRAEIDDVPRPRMRHVLALELADDGAVAALADVENWMLRHIVHKADAARAQNTPIGDVDDVPAKILDGIEALRLSVSSL